MTTLYSIRNRLTGGLLHRSLFTIKVFISAEKAREYMLRRHINPEFFEVVQIRGLRV